MVSVTVLSVSVWLVIEPCWKFGTTGTAIAGAIPTLAAISGIIYRRTFDILVHVINLWSAQIRTVQ